MVGSSSGTSSDMLKIHTTLLRKPDGSLEIVEMSLCPTTCPDTEVETSKGTLVRVSSDHMETRIEHVNPILLGPQREPSDA